MLSSISSIELKEMKLYVQDSIEFINARNESLRLIKDIVTVNQELDKIFKMDEDSLGELCGFNLQDLHKMIEDRLKTSAIYVQKFDDVSQKGREVLKNLD